jgi:methylglutaconyl-CoA hydratase
VHNAFDDAVIGELNAAIAGFALHPDVRVLLLCAEGRSFSAGADLGWMKRMADCSREENLADARELERLMRSLYEFPKPTLALVQGAAYGGAVGLVSCCDIAVASESASFALSEAKLGLAPAVISPYVIAAIGARQASRFFLTAERFSAATARELGLVHDVVPAEKLDGAGEHLLETLLANGPVALMACKSLLRRIAAASSPEITGYTTELIASLRTSQEGQEGLAAFFEKRQPDWQKKT